VSQGKWDGREKTACAIICDQETFGLGLNNKLARSALQSASGGVAEGRKAGVRAEAHQQSPLASYWLSKSWM
jgi:hypothetical protein